MVELQAEAGDERSVVEQRVTGGADEVGRHAATGEERLEVDRRALDRSRSRPPAHSTWATFRPPRSADWAIVSTCRTPGSKAAVRAVVNAWPTVKNVLLVEPWTAGHAPVARVYQPAPVFGGAWVSRPPLAADVPFFRNSFIVGMTPCPAYFATRSWRMPSDAKKTALSSGPLGRLLFGARPAPRRLRTAARTA